MDVAGIILQDHQIAYAIATPKLIVIEVGGMEDNLHLDSESGVGWPLLNLVPELVGGELLLEELLAGQTSRYEFPLINRIAPDNKVTYLSCTFLPYPIEDEPLPGVLLLVSNVTEMGLTKQALTQQRNELALAQDKLAKQNVELEIANAELRKLSELKSTFVSVAAHELRTPLTSIIGYIEVLLDKDLGDLPKSQHYYLTIVQRSTERLLDITNSLLDVTRIETDQIELFLAPIVLEVLVEEVIQEFESQLQVKSQTISFSSTLSQALVLCDETRTVQIISNLLNNASKYSEAEKHIEIKLCQADEKGFAQITVSDNGSGIAEEDLDKLFTAFYRTKQATHSGVMGVGLGLYVIQSLIELHGGRIWVDSILGEGTDFHFTLPLAE